jgi:hypothetical protein
MGIKDCMDIAVRIAELSKAKNYPDVPGPELLPTRLMRACAQILPVQAAGISVFTGFRHRVPLGASDDTAALADVCNSPSAKAHVWRPTPRTVCCWPPRL